MGLEFEKATRSGEQHHGPGHLRIFHAKGLDVFEVENVPIHECALDPLVCPVDEEAIVLGKEQNQINKKYLRRSRLR